MKPVRDAIQNAQFSIRDISERAATMDDVIRLDIGQPDFSTPAVVTERVADHIQTQNATYTSLWGIHELRSQIAAYESDKLPLDAENVMVTTGGTGAIYCILDTLLAPGETAVMNDPCWPPYKMIAAASPGTAKQVSYIGDDGTVNRDAIENVIDNDTQLLILNTPENPTGRVYTAEQVEELAAIAEKHDLYILADEVYDKLLYDDVEHVSPAQYAPERTLLVGSMSKNFAMTGWRIGWVAATDQNLIQELGKVNRATTACPNNVAQHAALYALKAADGYAIEMRREYQRRNDLVMNRIDDLGWDCVQPNGAIYAFPDVEQDAWDFAFNLLDEAGVAVVPGAACGSDSDTNIRICFGSADRDELRKAFDRISAYTG